MSAASAVARGRRLAETAMLSTCTITRPSGKPVWDEATGTYTDPPSTVVYSGRCKLQNTARAVGSAEAGERDLSISDQEIHLPVDGTGGVRKGDVVRIDSNPLDPSAVGARFVVQAPHAGTAKTARRLPVEAVV